MTTVMWSFPSFALFSFLFSFIFSFQLNKSINNNHSSDATFSPTNSSFKKTPSSPPLFSSLFTSFHGDLSLLLLWFEAISGLSINWEKITVMAVGAVENLDDLALELDANVGP